MVCMKIRTLFQNTLLFSCLVSIGVVEAANTTRLKKENEPKVPGFSISYMDQSIAPGKDFYQFANGNWIKNNPVPPDKSIWRSFSELEERNDYQIRGILENARDDKTSALQSPKRLVGNFYASAMDTARLEQLRFIPLQQDLAAIDQVKTIEDLFKLVASFHQVGIGVMFNAYVSPDAKDSSIYALRFSQGGITLPDKDYYLKDNFQSQREAYVAHIKKMFMLLGESPEDAAKHAAIIMRIETDLATASRSRVEMRDPNANYNKLTMLELINNYPSLPWNVYLPNRGIVDLSYAIVGQPEFFQAVNKLVKECSLADWKIYMRWHVLHNAASFLHQDVDDENFNFFGKTLQGKQEQEPRWKRSGQIVDAMIGEALGQLYVEKYFTAEARARMEELVNNLRVVFRDHLLKLNWMSDETRKKALAKFEKLTQKIGYPEKFRDYSSITITPDDYFGNVRRAIAFEEQRQMTRIGKPVDKTEWGMTPSTINAYFSSVRNEIVFPAGILQPPFFDPTMDDAVNYGGIAVVIGHEITHGYDDQGRKFNADGILSEWWTEKDAQQFNDRAKKVVNEYNGFEVLPGLFVNGELTLGENIADLGGISIAYDALQRVLQKDPSKRKVIDGYTPEQRFFISYAQIWRTNATEEETRRRITIDPHAPGQFRSFGPLLNYEEFYSAFNIKAGEPMWLAPELRTKIW